ncbi:patatin-like phospholipase family protein [Profundibacterium mesophilum]|uniref:Patatin-like phospholipase domain containing protein n=1 Tax=Profundibacterium mesophilum KAUST100406-0324 TaxID=1037889 RepID=A0A921NWC6_9RHOB|nr:patatin-like phospholipase family protein [Profundibacterium mesophilum]KAF0674753.1 Patatin-like phospholipase domain containing protein [Profundibacterium mesophilum KAUST100406-0324]
MGKRVNLALQGGGAHGAYCWGVLDGLLEDGRLEIAAISGTSAGALNGAALKAGLVEGGRDGARETLDWLWHGIGAIPDMRIASWLSELAPGTAEISRAIERSVPVSAADLLSRSVSPYSYGPLYRNPLEKIVADPRLRAVCAEEGPRLHVCATNVRSGKIRIFSGTQIGPQALLASTCLPTIFKAVEIEEEGRIEAYWDGGYTGNPALFPLFDQDLPADIVIVNINPLERDGIPYTAQEILNRINEISFNSSLLRELRAIDFVQRLIASGRMPADAMRKVLVHMIADDDIMTSLNVATKLVPSPIILSRLKAAGRAAAARFLDAHYDDLNECGTVDLRQMFG